MATQTPRQLYPLSTASGDAIPLDIIKPRGFRTYALALNTVKNLLTFADHEIYVFYSTVDTVLSFTGVDFSYPLVEGTEYEDTLFLPALTLITAESIAGTGKALSLEGAGSLRIQKIDKWASLALPYQAVKK